MFSSDCDSLKFIFLPKEKLGIFEADDTPVRSPAF